MVRMLVPFAVLRLMMAVLVRSEFLLESTQDLVLVMSSVAVFGVTVFAIKVPGPSSWSFLQWSIRRAYLSFLMLTLPVQDLVPLPVPLPVSVPPLSVPILAFSVPFPAFSVPLPPPSRPVRFIRLSSILLQLPFSLSLCAWLAPIVTEAPKAENV